VIDDPGGSSEHGAMDQAETCRPWPEIFTGGFEEQYRRVGRWLERLEEEHKNQRDDISK
jgi:hypothetical protein